jgi:hypothetical protein
MQATRWNVAYVAAFAQPDNLEPDPEWEFRDFIRAPAIQKPNQFSVPQLYVGATGGVTVSC